MSSLALVALPLLLVALGGGSAKADTSRLKAAYNAGFAAGKADKENGQAENLNPSVGLTPGGKPITTAEASYYDQGYAAGYKAGVKKPISGGSSIGNKDKETVEQAKKYGSTVGYANGLQDGSALRDMGHTSTKSPYTRKELTEAYNEGYIASYPTGYATGKTKAGTKWGETWTSDKVIMGDVLGTQGGPSSDFKPMGHYYDRNRPDGYPRSWYNY